MKKASEALAQLLDAASYGIDKRCKVIVDQVKLALCWDDLDLSWKMPPDSMDCWLPAVLEYVLIELGRNAYH